MLYKGTENERRRCVYRFNTLMTDTARTGDWRVECVSVFACACTHIIHTFNHAYIGAGWQESLGDLCSMIFPPWNSMHSRARGSEGLPDRPLEALISILKRIIIFPKNGWLSSRCFLAGSLAECWVHVETHEIRPRNSGVSKYWSWREVSNRKSVFATLFFDVVGRFLIWISHPAHYVELGRHKILVRHIEGNGVSVEPKLELWVARGGVGATAALPFSAALAGVRGGGGRWRRALARSCHALTG